MGLLDTQPRNDLEFGCRRPACCAIVALATELADRLLIYSDAGAIHQLLMAAWSELGDAETMKVRIGESAMRLLHIVTSPMWQLRFNRL